MKPSAILLPLNGIYAVVTRGRLAAYRWGWLSVSRLPVPVISVGNLTTGGTGKTPLVEWICRAIVSETGKKVCVLTRGYARENPKTQVVVSDGTQILAGERTAGDEPALLAKNLLGIAAVIANPNRVAAGEWAIENLHTEVFVLDDGFQHLRLARDLDIVSLDATNPWGGGSLLPYGRLRESTAGLSRADCVVITRTDQVQELASINAEIGKLGDSVPTFSSRMATMGIHGLDGASVDWERLRTKALGAFCGVGNPESFFRHLIREGCTLGYTRAFADHHHYNQSELDTLVKEAKAGGAEALVTTAKDALKLSELKLELPCYVLEIQITIDDEDGLRTLIRAACQNRE